MNVETEEASINGNAPLEMAKPERQVIIRGQTFLYRQKAPFVASGHSVLGALEYDEAEDKVRCHECGDWFRSVGGHAFLSHGLSAEDYKQRHGFRKNSPLTTESTRTKQVTKAILRYERFRETSVGIADPSSRLRNLDRARIKNLGMKRTGRQSQELKNLEVRCHAQLLERLSGLCERLGRTPTRADLREHGISPHSLVIAFNVATVGDVMSLVGMVPRPSMGAVGLSGRSPQYTKEICIELLRDFYVKYKRLPTKSDRKRGCIPVFGVFKKLFGSMTEAYREAGLGEASKDRWTQQYKRNGENLQRYLKQNQAS